MKQTSRIELRCSVHLALWLGAVIPKSTEEHRKMLSQGHHLLVRDTETGYPTFWLWMGAPPRLLLE